MFDYATARANMVESQLRTNKVTDPAVLDAFHTLPRELFVPEAHRSIAYIDDDLPLGHGRWLMEPMVLARLVQAADILPTDAAMEVGGGTGYGAAVLARTVIALEDQPELAALARTALRAADISNASVIEGPLREGYPSRAPFDVILLGGAVPSIPGGLTEQLAEGGRLIGVIKTGAGVPGQAVLCRRDAGVVSKRVLFDAAIYPLPAFAAEPAFVF